MIVKYIEHIFQKKIQKHKYEVNSTKCVNQQKKMH